MTSSNVAISAWVRACVVCGALDPQSLYPHRSMAEDPLRQCSICHADGLSACHVAFPATD